MTRISVLAACLLLAACSGDLFANAKTLRTQATDSLTQKNYGIAADKAYAATLKSPKDAEGFFLLAQAQAQLGRKNAALASLETAIANGFTDEEAIKGNANLAPLHNAEAYKELMAATFTPAPTDGAAPAEGAAAAEGTAAADAASAQAKPSGQQAQAAPQTAPAR